MPLRQVAQLVDQRGADERTHTQRAPQQAEPPRISFLTASDTSTPPRLLLAGVPVHVVAARLGHADPATTLRVYAPVIHEQAIKECREPQLLP
ncbi:hypothetical protein GCM10022419_006000 [Nonomuraea rosea]|uniref:Tyr recombinase domain-containing protein n=1 Tax=Nonomuraea rosea TaxID=638574 RepID=A0ABP6V9G0_9ACTN